MSLSGIASIVLAPHCRGAIGIDSTTSSIEDAAANAKINNIRNVNFTCGKVEKVCSFLCFEWNILKEIKT